MANHPSIRIKRLKSDICPYCRSALTLNDSLVVCRSCKTQHHQSCWNINHRCSVFGCTGKKSSGYGNNRRSSIDKKRQFNRPGKIGRNDRCPCGSDQKYKDCCLKKLEQGITIIAPGKGSSRARREAAFETFVAKKFR
jgi:hypothetical protein